MEPRGDRGSVSLLMVVVAALAGIAALGAVRVGGQALLEARAKATADLAALAGAIGGRDGAERAAGANHAALVRFGVSEDGGVTVTVRRDGVEARAAARTVP